MKRLWHSISWSSAIIAFIMGYWVLVKGVWLAIMLLPGGRWMLIKYILVWLLLGLPFFAAIFFKTNNWLVIINTVHSGYRFGTK